MLHFHMYIYAGSIWRKLRSFCVSSRFFCQEGEEGGWKMEFSGEVPRVSKKSGCLPRIIERIDRESARKWKMFFGKYLARWLDLFCWDEIPPAPRPATRVSRGN